MNYLCHLYLSGPDPELLAGNFAGDFVKGRLTDKIQSRFVQGLLLHRSIDSFAQTNPSFNRSRQRLAPEFGLYRGVLVDLYYDHFLAANWQEHSEELLPRYLFRARASIEQSFALLPRRLQRLLPNIFEDFIPAYSQPEGIAQVLTRLGQRVPRQNPLAEGGAELLRHYQELGEDFRRFLPEAKAHAAQFIRGLER